MSLPSDPKRATARSSVVTSSEDSLTASTTSSTCDSLDGDGSGRLTGPARLGHVDRRPRIDREDWGAIGCLHRRYEAGTQATRASEVRAPACAERAHAWDADSGLRRPEWARTEGRRPASHRRAVHTDGRRSRPDDSHARLSAAWPLAADHSRQAGASSVISGGTTRARSATWKMSLGSRLADSGYPRRTTLARRAVTWSSATGRRTPPSSKALSDFWSGLCGLRKDSIPKLTPSSRTSLPSSSTTMLWPKLGQSYAGTRAKRT